MRLWLLLTVVSVTVGELLYEGETSAVVELDGPRFSQLVSPPESGQWIIVFYANWCGHCQRFAPEFIQLAESHHPQQSTTAQFGAIDCATSASAKFEDEDLCRKFDIKAYPTIYLFDKGATVRELPKTIEELSNDLTSIFGSSGQDRIDNHKAEAAAGDLEMKAELATDPDSVMSDTMLAWFMLLHNEVFKGAAEELDEAGSDRLIHLLEICEKSSLPDAFRSKCIDLSDFVEERETALTRSHWIVQLDSTMSLHDQTFKSCKDFSCGMWRVLHLVTLSIDRDDDSLSADEGLEAVRFIVDHYFSCTVCRENFLSYYDKCDFDRCSMKLDGMNVAAWLIGLHNGVNRRLQKPQWPADSSVVSSVNQLRSVYGFPPLSSGVSMSGAMIVILIVFGLILVFACFRYLKSPALDRVRFGLRKKYQPMHIV